MGVFGAKTVVIFQSIVFSLERVETTKQLTSIYCYLTNYYN